MFEDRIAAINQQHSADCMTDTANQFEKRTYTVNEIQDILGIGRSAAYNLVKENHFHSVRIGGTIRISKKSFDTWLDRQS